MAKALAPKKSTGMNVITMKVMLRGIKPPVWRRLAMPGTMTLGDLHLAIQAAMGWYDCHLHAFDIGGEQYGDQRSVDDVADENRLTLSRLLRSSVVRFTYTYDFGDDWRHSIVVEEVVAADPTVDYPRFIEGARRAPPEDVGGLPGFEEFLRIMAAPDDPQHDNIMTWYGRIFEPGDIGLSTINERLAKLARRRAIGKAAFEKSRNRFN